MASSGMKERMIRWATVVAWGLAVAINAACVLVFLFDGASAAGFVILFLLGLAIAIGMLICAWRIWRMPTAPKVLEYLEQGVRLNLPLTGMLEAAAAGERGAVKNRLIALRNALEQGVGLDAALAAVLPEMSPRIGNQIAGAARAGRLEGALRRINKSGETPDPFLNDSAGIYRTYPWIVLVMMGGSVALLTIFVFPKFNMMARAWRPPFAIPWGMRAVLALESSPVWVAVWIAFGVVAVVMVGRAMKELFGRPGVRWMRGGVWTDYFVWWLPLLRSCARDRGMAELCESVADSIDAGEGMDQALQDAARSVGSDVLARRVTKWAEGTRAGETLSEGARKAGMPGLVVGMVATCRDGESLKQVMLFLGRHYRSRFSRGAQLIRSAYVPGVVLLLGMGVGLIEFSVFQYMVALIASTANFPGGF
jgi:type II secretory pathway component PulF